MRRTIVSIFIFHIFFCIYSHTCHRPQKLQGAASLRRTFLPKNFEVVSSVFYISFSFVLFRFYREQDKIKRPRDRRGAEEVDHKSSGEHVETFVLVGGEEHMLDWFPCFTAPSSLYLLFFLNKASFFVPPWRKSSRRRTRKKSMRILSFSKTQQRFVRPSYLPSPKI